MIDHQKFEKLRLNDKSALSKPVRRRQRQTVSCLPCRRLKVKCDRGHPCRHCVWSDRAASCQYAAFPTAALNGVTSSDDDKSTIASNSSQTPPDILQHPFLLPKSEPESFMSSSSASPATTASSKSDGTPKPAFDRYNSWNSKFRGSTNWVAVSRQIQYGHKYAEKSPLVHILRDVFERLKNNVTNPILPTNYPFGCGYQEMAPSKAQILSYVPNRATSNFYIGIYMNTIERTHPLLHPPSFYEEMNNFWEDPTAVDDGWLAQFLAMLGLGFHMSHGVHVTPAEEETLSKYFRGAETCLKSTPFLMTPTLTSLRSLCMMVIARRILANSCLELDACGPLMSTVMRMAVAIGLNVESPDDEHTTMFDTEMRRKLWTTMALMGTGISLLTGTPFMIRSADINIQMQTNFNDTDISPYVLSYPVIRPLTEFTDSTFSILVARSLHLAFDSVAHANSPSTQLSYEDVLVYSAKVKNLLAEAFQLYCQSNSTTPEDWKLDQKFMLLIFLRRILLALHSHYGLKPNGSVEYPISYWSTLECSLALLVIQRQLSEDVNSPNSRVWLGEFFKHDFYAAILTICLILDRNDTIDTAINYDGSFQNNIEIPQRETILQTLLCCRDIWARRICQTYCHLLSHMNLGTIIRSMLTPKGDNILSTEIYMASLRDTLSILKNCKCGNCSTEPGSVKGSFLNHPEYLAV